MQLTEQTYQTQINQACAAYDKYIICLDKPPQDCHNTLQRLLRKAIKAYQNRAPGLRHGIALDPHITIILSQTENPQQPLCAIYFNLHTPYHKKQPTQPTQPTPNQPENN